MSIGLWLKRIIGLGILAVGFAACAPTPVPISNDGAVALRLTEGQAMWFRFREQENVPVPATASVSWEDEISSPADQGAVLQLAENTVVRLNPDSRIKLRPPYSPDTRPVIRLLRGGVHISAHSTGFIVESYREVPLSLRIVLVNMILEPRGGESDFELVFDMNTAKARVNSGEVDVRATDARGTLLAEWKAELMPGEALQIIAPYTATPEFSATPTASLTPTPTETPTWTSTPTRAPTRRPVTATPTALPTLAATVPPATPVPPTPDDGGGDPKPTKVPPPTDTLGPPPPTPEPPTETARPTPGI